MMFRLTKYGWPQVVIFPLLLVSAMALFLFAPLPVWLIVLAEAILAVFLVFSLAFFRDPYRVVPKDSSVLLAPADGKVTDIEKVVEDSFIGGSVLRIGIFLSIFDVHVNRSPCSVKVEKIGYKEGRYVDARNPEAGRVNESNDLFLVRTEAPQDRLIVRQISGAIARRIVCRAKEGRELTGGERFGMIKFGSRTELYVPADSDIRCLVEVGDRVKAGLTSLIKYNKCQD
ncbi:MAG: phosphatidylserine decarboxylase [Planctomycetota bacterium]|jgi:phosphatidylserine decarboxylase